MRWSGLILGLFLWVGALPLWAHKVTRGCQVTRIRARADREMKALARDRPIKFRLKRNEQRDLLLIYRHNQVQLKESREEIAQYVDGEGAFIGDSADRLDHDALKQEIALLERQQQKIEESFIFAFYRLMYTRKLAAIWMDRIGEEDAQSVVEEIITARVRKGLDPEYLGDDKLTATTYLVNGMVWPLQRFVATRNGQSTNMVGEMREIAAAEESFMHQHFRSPSESELVETLQKRGSELSAPRVKALGDARRLFDETLPMSDLFKSGRGISSSDVVRDGKAEREKSVAQEYGELSDVLGLVLEKEPQLKIKPIQIDILRRSAGLPPYPIPQTQDEIGAEYKVTGSMIGWHLRDVRLKLAHSKTLEEAFPYFGRIAETSREER